MLNSQSVLRNDVTSCALEFEICFFFFIVLALVLLPECRTRPFHTQLVSQLWTFSIDHVRVHSSKVPELPADVTNMLVFIEDFIYYSGLSRKASVLTFVK